MDMASGWVALRDFIALGGPAMWAIAAMAALTGGAILWKLGRLVLMGAWSGAAAQDAVARWIAGDRVAARARVARRSGLRGRVVAATFAAIEDPALNEASRREEVARIAQEELGHARGGLRLLELVATIAPLVGLLGTVLGMIGAFQTLQEAGSRADPAMLAGGIWEALLTTAAGMAVAIPASVALVWFESIADRAQAEIEGLATRILTRSEPAPVTIYARAAE